jgi:curved DNA-binding protein CbpA
MSSAPSGKFQDHYVILGVEPGAESEAIQLAYQRLSQKYHPNTPETGNKEKFETINAAYEVLADPELRAEFDKIKGVDQEKGPPKFSGELFFAALRKGFALRTTLLCLFYDRRRTKPTKPALSMRHLEGMLNTTVEELDFALWYLKQRGYVANDDKSSLLITVEGMDYVEANPPTADGVMEQIKPEAVAGAPPAAKPVPVPQPAEPVHAATGSVLSALNRAIARTSAAAPELPAALKR